MAKDIKEETPVITPEVAGAAMTFLSRVQLQATEIQAFQHVYMQMQAVANTAEKAKG